MKKELVTLPLSELKPYKKNARKNDATIPDLAEDIKQVGYISPIIIDEKNEMLAGHSRLRALQYNGETEAEVMRVTGLTQEQKRKFRIFDNKIGEKSEWDFDLLAEELTDLNFGGLSLDWGLEEPSLYEEDDDEDDVLSPKERFWEIANFKYYDETRTEGKYNFPTNEATQHWPTGLIGFHDLNNDRSQYVNGVHFFIHDYKFECFWNNPTKYFKRFSKYDCVIAPDYSTYTDMSLAHVIWNLYRNRLLVQMMQDYGLTVIPTLQYAGEDTLEWCFDGIEGGGTVAVSTVGVMKDEEARKIWGAGMAAALEKIQPKTVVCYGVKPDFDFRGTETVFITPRQFT